MAKKNKKSKRRLAIFGTISILVICYFVFNLCYYSYHILVLKQTKANLQAELISLKNDEEELSNDIQKLKDPEYIAKYARENYMYSKDGEYIIKIKDDLPENVEIADFDYEYFIIIGVLGLLIIVLYVIKRKHA